MSNTQQQRLVVEQLRREAGIKRITVRQAVADIMVTKLAALFSFLYQFVILNFHSTEICLRPPAGRLFDGRVFKSEGQSLPGEKQLLTIINLAE